MIELTNDLALTDIAERASQGSINRSSTLKMAAGFAAALSAIGTTQPVKAAAGPESGALLDAKKEARKIAFDRVGNGEKILLISGFPQTRRSWDRLVPLLSSKFELIPADLPSFGESGILSAPAATENVGQVFHEFVAGLDAPLHVVAHDFGAWVAMGAAIQGRLQVPYIDRRWDTGGYLSNDIQLSDCKRKWNFIFQMLPDMPAELIKGKEDVYVGWWFKNKVFRPGAIWSHDVAGYVRAYARKDRMDAAFDYCRKIVEDMVFNAKHFNGKLSIPLLAVGGDHSIPTMGESLQPSFEHVTSIVVPESGHFVPEEQPEFLAKALLTFLGAHA